LTETTCPAEGEKKPPEKVSLPCRLQAHAVKTSQRVERGIDSRGMVFSKIGDLTRKSKGGGNQCLRQIHGDRSVTDVAHCSQGLGGHAFTKRYQRIHGQATKLKEEGGRRAVPLKGRPRAPRRNLKRRAGAEIEEGKKVVTGLRASSLALRRLIWRRKRGRPYDNRGWTPRVGRKGL